MSYAEQPASPTEEARARLLEALELDHSEPDFGLHPNTAATLNLKLISRLDEEGYDQIAGVVRRAKDIAVERGSK